MGIPFFQQQSAAYNTYLKNNLYIFTPDGQRYRVDVHDKPYDVYAEEVRKYLVPFEVDVLLARRNDLREALTLHDLIRHFCEGDEAHFAGMDMDSVSAELKLRGIEASTIKSALRSNVARVAGEVKKTWPIRESGRTLQYLTYDIVFAMDEVKTADRRQKIWDDVAAWACVCKLPGKEGARLATVQDWDESNNHYSIRVDIHRYPRPDLDSCRAITLLDVAERKRDFDILRQSLAHSGVALDEIVVNPHAAPPTPTIAFTSPPSAVPLPLTEQGKQKEPSLIDMPPPKPARSEAVLAETVTRTLAAVRIERDYLDQQVRQLSDALTDHDERQRQAHHIQILEMRLNDIAAILDNLVWPSKPSDWLRLPVPEKADHIVKSVEHISAILGQYEKSLQIAKSELHMLAMEQRETRKSHEQQQSRADAELREMRESRDQLQNRITGIEDNIKEELLKQNEAAMLAQEIDFTRKIQNMQQERMRETQQLRNEHLRQLEQQQDEHLKQIQKLRRLMPAEDALHIEPEEEKQAPSAAASKLVRYQAESQEIFDKRMGEYLRIAKDQGLSQADEWLLVEAKKLAKTRGISI